MERRPSATTLSRNGNDVILSCLVCDRFGQKKNKIRVVLKLDGADRSAPKIDKTSPVKFRCTNQSLERIERALGNSRGCLDRTEGNVSDWCLKLRPCAYQLNFENAMHNVNGFSASIRKKHFLVGPYWLISLAFIFSSIPVETNTNNLASRTLAIDNEPLLDCLRFLAFFFC